MIAEGLIILLAMFSPSVLVGNLYIRSTPLYNRTLFPSDCPDLLDKLCIWT